MLETEKNGVPKVIKYEELGSSENVCVSKLQNKTKNFTGQKNIFATEKPSLGLLGITGYQRIRWSMR